MIELNNFIKNLFFKISLNLFFLLFFFRKMNTFLIVIKKKSINSIKKNLGILFHKKSEEKNYSLNIILKFSNFFASYTYADWVQVNCKNLNYDMVIAHGVTSLMTAKFFKNKNNYLVYDSIEIPSLMHEIENPTSISESFILSQLSNDLKVFDSYFTVSERLKGILTNSFRLQSDKVCVLRNYPKSEHFTIEKKKLKLDNTKPNIIIFNSIYHTDNLKFNLEIIKKLQAKYNFNIIIDLKKFNIFHNINLEKYIKEKDIKLKIFDNFFRYEDLISNLKNFDLVWSFLDGKKKLNSLVSLPNRVFDSYAAQIPIIQMEGCPEISNFILKNKTGEIYKYQSIDDLNNKINKVLSQKKKLFSK